MKKSNGKLYWTGVGSDPLYETDLAGNNQTEYIFFGGKRVARRDPNGSVFYYFSDHLGSASVVTTSTGTIVEESDYYPFGGERIITNSDPNQYKFTGKERDPESGLDYFTARHYASNLGRFLQPDEFSGGPVDAFSSNDPLPQGPLPYTDITNPQSLNKYTYTYNNPLRYTDPLGHCPDGMDVCFMPQLAQDKNYMDGYYEGAKAGLKILFVLLLRGHLPEESEAQQPNQQQPQPKPEQGNPGESSGAAPEPPEPENGGSTGSGDRPGMDFTPAGKREIDERDGDKCRDCARDVRSVQNRKGEPTPEDQRQRHHIVPKSEGGSGTPDNGKTLCPACHKDEHRRLREEKKTTGS